MAPYARPRRGGRATPGAWSIASPATLGQPGNRYLKDLPPLDVARERQIIVDALTQLGGGDPIPVLTDVLLYHVAPTSLSPVQVIFSPSIDTLLAADEPLSVDRLERLFEEGEARPHRGALREALASIAEDCEARGFELKEVGSGYRFQVRQDLAPWVGRLWEERPPRYSRALMETLSLIAYRQPITRGEIEDVRGVSVSTNISLNARPG